MRRRVTRLLHAGLLTIVVGALLSWLTGWRGTVDVTAEGAACEKALPFGITLVDCATVWHDGTDSPLDYTATFLVDGEEMTISMNKPLDVGGWRLCLKSMTQGRVTLAASHDPLGKPLALLGAMLALIAWGAIIIKPRINAIKKAVVTTVCLTIAFNISAQPSALQPGLAKKFCAMQVMHKGRIQPMSSMARDFCRELTGSESWQGLTAEQVLTGWLFHYDEWKRVPMIRVKGDAAVALGVDGKYAALTDFFDSKGYKLDTPLAYDPMNKSLREADARVDAVSKVCTGAVFKIIPWQDGWLSWADTMPADMPIDRWQHYASGMDDVARLIATGRNIAAAEMLDRLAADQLAATDAGALPQWRVDCERIYNKVCPTSAIAGSVIILGIVLFIFPYRRWLRIVPITAAIYIIGVLALRGVILGRWPMSNGPETMITMAALCAIAAVWMKRPAAGIVAEGLSLLVASLGQDKGMGVMMPVLDSPLLAMHVLAVMAAYALLLIVALTSVASLSKRSTLHSSLSTLNTAVWLLAAGIVLGAVWADVSWGRYWGWDPKEICALLTLLVYAVPLHATVRGRLLRGRRLYIYLLLAFLMVPITYFGANYLLPGLHSYA